MIREKIVHTAYDLFIQYGVKSVSMDEIAKSAGISKRTLYESFEDKESLLAEGIEQYSQRLKQTLAQIERGAYNALEIILLFYEEIMKQPNWHNEKFYDDLKKYPNVQERIESHRKRCGEKCMALLTQGVKEGVFEKDVNLSLTTTLIRELMKMVQPSHAFNEYSIIEVYSMILLTFLRGISTEKGRLIIDRFDLKRSYQS